MIAGVPRESFPGERRVALTPAALPLLAKAGVSVLVEAGAGSAAGYLDADFEEKGAKIAASREEVFSSAEVILQVRTLGANPEAGRADLELMRKDQVVIGSADPLGEPGAARDVAATGAVLFGLELIPRITRAQSMDILSAMATIAGYKAVLAGADHLPRMFPLMMTAAGTLAAAHVFVVGAGVAGLQAIGSARKLGAIVHAYDVRPAVKEQVESLGGKFVEMELEAGSSEDKGGYAREMDEEFYRKQRELMGRVVAESDVVITTAAIPGKKSPVLITKEMVAGMKPGSVIVDLAAERGGNCELTKAGETTVEHGVTILGPTNLPSEVPYHASQMYGKNIATFLLNMVKDGELDMNPEDEIVRDTMLARGGDVVHTRLRELLGMENAAATGGDA
ncbi:MAG: Re/Si-specific NAD(P)(+) transhydrogenase subunit alpha [Gemmatimonadota bacterium]|nr:Re/Si-specific NAD(P)(+) transhydrogenase subunit alpha [Gemmatimonadota bacterium]MDP6529196.1 Re/Si-specific NAD(P)(+) transhydrogenase subunit alpha [Gemmatimonadota bacterium]MDP6801678.1 Re/Si-specific NAD(P)(+) transhydrogenase subunit alpha [Gemmatimonadota bacterium]MDP7030775.1 Re/Si-specific NAD(P)(+) transhydrogenase subunit alpha [Gemmatimonadota bacterium]